MAINYISSGICIVLGICILWFNVRTYVLSSVRAKVFDDFRKIMVISSFLYIKEMKKESRSIVKQLKTVSKKFFKMYPYRKIFFSTKSENDFLTEIYYITGLNDLMMHTSKISEEKI